MQTFRNRMMLGLMAAALVSLASAAEAADSKTEVSELRTWLKAAGLKSSSVVPWPALKVSAGSAFRSASGAVFFKLDEWPTDGKLNFPRLNNRTDKIYLLGDAKQKPLNIKPEPAAWTIALPKKLPAGIKPVVVMETKDKPHLPVKPAVIARQANGVFSLPAHRAVTHGAKLRYEPQPHKNTVGYWANPKDWAEWHLKFAEPGRFELHVLQGCGKGQGGSDVEVSLAGDAVTFTVEDTGHFQNFKWRNVGRFNVKKAGTHVLQVKPKRLAVKAVMDVRQIKLVPVGSTAARPADRLNVIVVLVDDLGWMDLGCQGSRYYETPHIDKLAAQGMRFTDAYAACAVCSPTRAAVMTGRYPGRTGVTDWIRARFQRGGIGTPKQNRTEYVGGRGRKLLCPPNPYWLESEEDTIAEALKPAGYVSCHIGKWHLGDEAWFPQHQGFDFNFGGCDYGQPPSYFDPFTNKRLTQGIPHLPSRKPGQYLSDREADEAVGFIRKHKDQPFFLYLANYAVHTPIQAKKEVAAKYEAKRSLGLKNPAYAAMVESVDDAVGRVTETLDELDLSDRTVVIFTSDNGGLDRNGNPTENAPLRSGKGYAYEGGIRVPLIVRWPGVIRAGSISHEPVISVDYLPTILTATKTPLPRGRDIDGLSLVAHFKSGGSKPLGRDAIYWHFPHYRHPPGPYSIIRSGDWKLIKFYDGPKFELFNPKDDLSEADDLAQQMPEKVRQLDSQLSAHLKSVGAKLPRANPDFRAASSKKK